MQLFEVQDVAEQQLKLVALQQGEVMEQHASMVQLATLVRQKVLLDDPVVRGLVVEFQEVKAHLIGLVEQPVALPGDLVVKVPEVLLSDRVVKGQEVHLDGPVVKHQVHPNGLVVKEHLDDQVVTGQEALLGDLVAGQEPRVAVLQVEAVGRPS